MSVSGYSIGFSAGPARTVNVCLNGAVYLYDPAKSAQRPWLLTEHPRPDARIGSRFCTPCPAGVWPQEVWLPLDAESHRIAAAAIEYYETGKVAPAAPNKTFVFTEYGRVLHELEETKQKLAAAEEQVRVVSQRTVGLCIDAEMEKQSMRRDFDRLSKDYSSTSQLYYRVRDERDEARRCLAILQDGHACLARRLDGVRAALA